MDTSMYDRQIQAAENEKNRQAQRELFQLKGSSGMNTPAALQLANAYEEAVKAGDMVRANNIAQFAKTLPKGMGYGSDGSIGNMQGVIPSMSEQSFATQSGKDQSELQYANPTKKAERLGTLEADAQGAANTKTRQANDQMGIIGKARNLLQSGDPSGSFPGAAMSSTKQFFGRSDKQTQGDAELEMLGGWLTANVPRMEGPQSNFDVENYKTMAARVGDKKIPREDRLAALQALEQLQQKYAGQADWGADPARMSDGARGAFAPSPDLPPNLPAVYNDVAPAMPDANATVEGAAPRRKRYNPETGRIE